MYYVSNCTHGITMYISRSTSKRPSGKIYESILLRESYREDGKVKKRTLMNLSGRSEDEIKAIEFALKNVKKGFNFKDDQVKTIQGKSIGTICLLYEIAKKLGIVKALGNSFHAKLALWLIFARILEQGSRLSAVRLNSFYDIASVIKLEKGFDENNFYDCLHWLDRNQESIEDNLFKSEKSSKFYWYDVTSSYFEGEYNDFAMYGHNRDKKTRKKIVVIGLLCQDEGKPISIEAFKGNTQDTQTFESQLIKLKNRFSCDSITIVGDRGIIRDKQKEMLKKYNFHYITGVPMTQIRPLLNAGILKYEEFENSLKSIEHKELRYIYRRNPVRAEETKKDRENRLRDVKKKIQQENERLTTSLRALLTVSKRKLQGMIDRLEISDFVKLTRRKREFFLEVDQEKLEEKARFDGCYVWTTDWKETELSNEEVFENYKNLKYVEDDFRTFKSMFLDIRPIFVRSASSTRGHLLVTMLAHMIVRELRSKWLNINKTVSEGLQELSLISRQTIQWSDNEKLEVISEPNESMKQLLSAIGVKLPTTLEEVKINVVTTHKVREAVNF